MSDNRKNKKQTNLIWLSSMSMLLLVCTFVFFKSKSIEQGPNTAGNTDSVEASEQQGERMSVATTPNPAELKTAEIRTQLHHALEKQASNATLNRAATHLDHTTNSKYQPASSGPSKHDEHDHQHEDPSEIIDALSPEVIAAIGEMTHQTKKGTVMTATTQGNLLVDMGDAAFRAVPVATIDENGQIKITEFFEPPEKLN